MFPVLFGCSSNKDAFIASLLTRISDGASRVWNITFIREFNDWEIEEVLTFFNFIQCKIPGREVPDAMRWKPCKHGLFDTRSFYHALRGNNEIKFPWKSNWGVKAPRRVSFFVWIASWGKILTCDNLMRRGYNIVGWCCMCRCA
jgi:hypothetical protein